MDSHNDGTQKQSRSKLSTSEENAVSTEKEERIRQVLAKQIVKWPNNCEPNHCSNCLGVPFGEIRFCNYDINGHMLCRYCLQTIPGVDYKKCPCCPRMIKMNGSSRCELLENVIKFGIFRCPLGCGRQTTGEKMIWHIEDQCVHRKVACPLCYETIGDDGTFYAVKVGNLLDHLNEHDDPMMNVNTAFKFQIAFNRCANEKFIGVQHLRPHLFKSQDKYFILSSRVQRFFGAVDVVVLLVQIIEEAEKGFQYRSVITLTSNEENTVTWNIPVVGHLEKRPKDNSQLSFLTLSQLQGYCSEFVTTQSTDYTRFKFEVKVVIVRTGE